MKMHLGTTGIKNNESIDIINCYYLYRILPSDKSEPKQELLGISRTCLGPDVEPR